jgi:hypothetical protein
MFCIAMVLARTISRTKESRKQTKEAKRQKREKERAAAVAALGEGDNIV